MEKSGAPPYEANPTAQYAQQPVHQQAIAHHDSYNNQAIAPAHPMASPNAEPKQEYYAPQQQQVAAPQQSTYQTAVPLASLQDKPAPVDCPMCKNRAMTRIDAVSGNTTHAWAAVICFCCCLGCIPYMIRSLKDIEHHCGHCGCILATWHNSGRTVAEAHA